MKNTHEIANAVGRSKMADALNIGATAVSKAVVGGKFPPAWFLVMSSLCKDRGIECPPELFGMKSTNGQSDIDVGTIDRPASMENPTAGGAS